MLFLFSVSEPGSEEYLFELRVSDPFTLTVTFEHPCTPSMASSKSNKLHIRAPFL